jgi:type IV pilus assembly protein PilV
MCGTSVNLAAFDLARWWANSVSVQLPNPTVTVSCPAAPLGNPAPVSCTVQISWTEKAVAINSTEAAQEEAAPGASSAEKPVFTLYVEP